MRTTSTRVSTGTGDSEDTGTLLDDVRGDTASVLSEQVDNESVNDALDAKVVVIEEDCVPQSPSDGEQNESQEEYGSDSDLAEADESTDPSQALDGEGRLSRLSRRKGFTDKVELNLLRFLIAEVSSISAENIKKKVDFYETCKERIRTCDDDDELLACIPKDFAENQRLQTYISNLVKAEVKREKEMATLIRCRAEFCNDWVSAWEELKDSNRKRSDKENNSREAKRRRFSRLASAPSSVSVTSNDIPSPRSRTPSGKTRVSNSDVTNDMRTMMLTFFDAARAYIANMNQWNERNLASQDRESDMKQIMDKLRSEFRTLQENIEADSKRLEKKIDEYSRRMENKMDEYSRRMGNKMDDYSLLLVQKVQETLAQALSKSPS